MSHKKLILASSSPYRRELLERLKLPFISISPDLDETPLEGETPEATALRLAQEKALKIGQSNPNALIIGCDQVATFDTRAIGKPLTFENAFNQLKQLSGKTVTFHSALCLLNSKSNNLQATIVKYEVRYKHLTESLISRYLTLEEPYMCAGSVKSEGLGITLMEWMRGDDPTALIGLPLIALSSMLANEGVAIV